MSNKELRRKPCGISRESDGNGSGIKKSDFLSPVAWIMLFVGLVIGFTTYAILKFYNFGPSFLGLSIGGTPGGSGGNSWNETIVILMVIIGCLAAIVLLFFRMRSPMKKN